MNTLKFGNGEWYGKKDTILAYNDENSNFKPLAFNFERDTTATRVNKDGLIETVGSGEPRIDYKDDSKGALKLEPSRSNYQPYSTVFSSWGVVDVTVGLNYGLSPDGFNNSVLITEGTGSTQHRIVKGSPASSGIYTLSCFVKNKVGNRQAYIDMGAVTGFFNFDTETMFSATGTTSVESWSNGWYRISITSNTNVTPIVNYLGTGKNNSETFQGDGSSAIEFFAPQLEQGSYPTSIIPTQGSIGTRVAEVVNNTNSLMSGLTDMAMFVDYQLPNGNSAGFRNQLGFRDNQNANFYMIQFPNSNTHEFRYTGVSGVNVDMTPSISEQDYGLKRKLLFTKTGNTLKVFCNGVEVSTVTNALATTFSTTPERLNAGDNYDFDMDIKEWKLYNNGFTDAEAITLTTI